MSPQSSAVLRRLIVSGCLIGLGADGLLQTCARADQAEDSERLVMERFRAVLERAPRRGTALDRVYGYHVERGTLDALIKTYADRTARDPHDGAAWLLLGLFEAQRGRDAAAVTAFGRAEEERKDDALPAYYLGQALVLVGQPDAAAGALERALARHPARNDLLEIFQALGRIHERAHRNDQALAVWTRLEALFPDDARVQEQIASALAEEAQLEPALARYEALTKTSRDPSRRALFRLEAADLKVRLGRPPEALRDLEGLLGGLDPESWLAREVRRRIEDVFLRNDDQSGLAGYYERWLKASPDDVEAMARLGRILAAQGRAAEARTWFDQAVKRAPSRKELRLALVEQLVHERKFTEAASQYEAISRSNPNHPDVVREWGRLLLRDTSRPEGERKQAATAVWNRLLESRPRDPAMTAQVAELFRQAGFSAEAIALYEKAVALAPDAPQYREYLGEYFHALKRPADALSAWRAIAAGPNRNAKNLTRLAEVIAGYGYKEEATAVIAEACALDADSFALRLKHADLLLDGRRFDEVDVPLDAAERLAGDEDQREAVLARRVAADQGANRLDVRIESLTKDVAGAQARDASTWRRLARYHEAARHGIEAIAAIEKAVALDGASVASWSTAARLYEAGGRLADAAAVDRRLAALDRRARTEYLSAVARLEARLGRRDEALQAGRDLLAAAPGNREQVEFFAGLCFQLGAHEEGLEVLRRAVRGNETDPQALRSLAEALAREFRTAESIELYWRAFDKTADLDGKLAVVSRLTELYLQRNQLDRLLDRLERYQAEPAREREGTLCLAQAYAAAGDFGTARQQLESLLVANPRDTALLKQLSELAESEGDLVVATRYQKRLNEVAPSHDAARRLVQLALRADEFAEAEAVWTQAMEGDQEPARVLQAIDDLLGLGKYDAVLATTRRLLLKDPNNWELLYRQAYALWTAEGPAAAAARFRELLDLRRDDDEVSVIVKARRKSQPPMSTPVAGIPTTASLVAIIERVGIRYRFNAARVVRGLCGLDPVYGRALGGAGWSPLDFGTARMAAYGFLLAQAGRENATDALLRQLRQAREQAPHDARPIWDEFYVALLLDDGKKTYDTALDLARAASNDPSAGYALLYTMMLGGNSPSGLARAVRGEEGETRPPLPPGDADLVRDAFITLARSYAAWGTALLVDTILSELDRAGRGKDLDTLYRELVVTGGDLSTISVASEMATHRGDFDALWKLFDSFNRLPLGTRSTIVPAQPYLLLTPAGAVYVPAYHMARALRQKTGPGAHAEILHVLDDYMTALRSPALAAERRRLAKKTASTVFRYDINVIGNVRQYLSIDYPVPGAYLDGGAILFLRTAFERFKRDDVLSDLLAHVGRRADAAAEDTGAELYYRLELNALLYWAGDNDGALRALERAVTLVPGDSELKLTLAEFQAQRGDLATALETVESVEVVDQDLTQRRELLALRLAVQAGRVERARQAAERLFGLRLDSSIQVLLAAQMHQLGMHELAEAVLARARRRAGNNTDALLGLMTQYQRQGNSDAAIQIAHQVLRRSGSSSGLHAADLDYPAQRQAIQLLARLGKLDAIIARLEDQLKQSPESLQLHQSLAAYYRAAGQRDKARDITEAMVRIRPDDSRIRMQVAAELAQSGDTAAALGHIRTALVKEPRLYAVYRREIHNAFQQQKKMGELLTLLEEVGLRSLDDPYSIAYMVVPLLENPATVDEGMAHWRKIWEAYPDPSQRFRLLTDICWVKEIWSQPELYDQARQVMIPGATVTRVEPWLGLDVRSVGRSSPDGRILSLASRLLEAATRLGRLEDLAGHLEEPLRRLPQWLGGKALLGLIRVRQGRFDEAKRILQPIVLEPAAKPPMMSLLIMGQELRDLVALQALARAIYERAISGEERSRFSAYFEESPIKHLATLSRRGGQTSQARSLLLEQAAEYRTGSLASSLTVSSYLKIHNLVGVAGSLLEIGCPSDASSVYAEVLGATNEIEPLPAARRSEIDEEMRLAREGIERALRGLTPETLGTTLRAMVRPPGQMKGSMDRPIDLRLVVHPRALDQATVTSLLPQALAMAKEEPELLAELKANLSAARKADPDDLVAATAELLLKCAVDEPAAVAEAAGRLERRVAASPLEALSEGTRPNARQRADAAQRLGLWLVARACWKHEAARDLGDRLAAAALEAARRQTDTTWALAMLGEWGRQAEDRGDRAAADLRWGGMLDLVSAQTGVAPARATQGSARRAAAGNGTPAITPERFEQACEIARLAAAHGHYELSLRAVRDALRGGPPVVVVPLAAGSARGALAVANARGFSLSAPSPEASALVRLAELERVWQSGAVSPALVYETLRDVVLPPGRPAELFLYAAPLAAVDRAPASVRPIPPRARSAGALLTRWAVAAGRTEELRERIAQRQARPGAELNALMLRALLAQAERQPEAVATALEAIDQKLDKDTSQSSAELACHAALPALDSAQPATARIAVAIIERAARALGSGTEEEPVDSLLLTLARFEFEQANDRGGRNWIEEAVATAERAAARTVLDDPLYRRKRVYADAAHEYLRAGHDAKALDLLGQFADASAARGGDPPVGSSLVALARRVAAWQAAERYERLKTWSFPTPTRRSVRLLAGFVSESSLADTASLLIAAARDTGKLDELGTELGELDRQGVDNARALLILVEIARGRCAAVAPLAQAVAADLPQKWPERNPLVSAAMSSAVGTPPAWADILVAHACLAEPALRALGETMARDLITHAERARAAAFQGLLVRLFALAKVDGL
jgi:predicted Zn-dependent protease